MVYMPLVVIVGDPVVLDTSAEVSVGVPLPKGRNDHVLVAVFMQVPPAFCEIVKVPFTVTPDPGVTVTTPAPKLTSTIFVPTA
jgi:hypothetical protein